MVGLLNNQQKSLKGHSLKTLLLDIDNVVCDFNSAMISYINSVKNTSFTPLDLKYYSYLKSKLVTDLREWKNLLIEFFESEYASGMKPMPGAIESIKVLMTKYNVVYATSRKWHLYDKTIKMLDTWGILPPNTSSYGRHDCVRMCGDNGKKYDSLRWQLNNGVGLAGMVDDNESEFGAYLADPNFSSAKYVLLSSIRNSHLEVPPGVEKCVLWTEVMQHL